ncbi:MAG: hypothetical protein IPJ58_05725 [Ardenticatenia bacterium]|nr:hypothetical protein [Ardenticatenia bacterium]
MSEIVRVAPFELACFDHWRQVTIAQVATLNVQPARQFNRGGPLLQSTKHLYHRTQSLLTRALPEFGDGGLR